MLIAMPQCTGLPGGMAKPGLRLHLKRSILFLNWEGMQTAQTLVAKIFPLETYQVIMIFGSHIANAKESTLLPC